MTTNTTSVEAFIKVIPKVASPEVCANIIESTRDSPYWKAAEVVGGGVASHARNCDVLSISTLATGGVDLYQELDQTLFAIASKVVNAYSDDHPLNITRDIGYTLLRYEVGQFYVQHTDSCPLSNVRSLAR